MKLKKNFTIFVFCVCAFFAGCALVQQAELRPAKPGTICRDLENLAKKRETFATEAADYLKRLPDMYKLSEEDELLANLVRFGLGEKKGTLPDSLDLPAEKRLEVRYKAAKIFMYARMFETADLIGRTVAKPVPEYSVAVVEKAPIGVYGWKNSDLLKKNLVAREDRFENYNEKGAAVLYTDVNANRSTVDVTKKSEKCGVSFFAVADSYGISFYVESKDAQIADVRAGLANAGMLEMYLQPGFGNAYYQWLYEIYPAKADIVDWMSPNEHFRSLKGRLSYETQPIPEGFGVYFFIPWELVYDNLPTSDSEWAFGVIPWTRDGGFTWGSGQVHELHKFGRLHFPGIERLLPAIKRQLVMKAFGNFKKSFNAIEVFWSDEIRGDVSFYQNVLKPYIQDLNEAGKSVSASMSDEIAEELFQTYVPQWNEFSFKVDLLRADYLKKKYIGTNRNK